MKANMVLRTAGLTLAAITISAGAADMARARPAFGRGVAATANRTSTTYAGYTGVLPGGSQTESYFTVKVPTVTCGNTSAIFLGNSLKDSDNILLAAGNVTIECTNGEPEYLLGAQGYNHEDQQFVSGVQPGDTVQIGVSTDTSGGSSVDVTDDTSGASVSDMDPNSTAPATEVLDILNDPGMTTIPTFGTIKFKNAEVNGAPLSSFSPVASDLKSGSHLQAETSALTAAGNGFTITFTHR